MTKKNSRLKGQNRIISYEETNERIEEIIDVSEQEEEEFYDVSPKPTNPKP